MKKFWAMLLCLGLGIQVVILPASAQADVPFEVHVIEEGEPSEYGYVDYHVTGADNEGITEEIFEYPQYSQAYYSVNIPANYDSRSQGYITSVKNQGSSGTCWAFAAISALEAQSIAQGIDDLETADYSEAHLVWFSKNSLVNEGNDYAKGDGTISASPYSDGGNSRDVTATLSRWSGLAEEADYPFYPQNLTAMGNYGEANRYDKNSKLVLKSSEDLIDNADVKQWIMEHGAATVAFYSDDSNLNKTKYAYYCKKAETTNHAVAIVGWDDDYAKKNFKLFKRPDGNGAWLCKNSWDSSWGNDGYFWISYEDASLTDFVGYTTQKADKFTNNYTYNGDGYSAEVTGGTSPKIANVFKARSYEVISHIATYTLQTDTVLSISIYKNLPSDYTSPVEGDLVASWTTNILRSGYHTISVPEEILLKPGTVFSVVIKIECLAGKPAMPFEVGERYSFNEGESFLNTGGSWRDVTEYSSDGLKNSCVQAFTKPVLEHNENAFINFKDNILITSENDFSHIKANVDIFKNSEFFVKDMYGNSINHFATGSTLTVYQNSDSVTMTVVVEGDTNGDGVCDALDVSETEIIANGHKNSDTLQCYAANGCVAENIDSSAYQNVVNKALSS